MEFQLASIGIAVFIYSSIMLIISAIAYFAARRFFKKLSILVIMRVCAVLFALSILYPICIPLWTKVIVDDSTLVVRGALFSNQFNISDLRTGEMKLYEKLPDSLMVKRRANGVRFSDLSIGTFTLKGGFAGTVYATRADNFVVIPTIDRRYVILTLKNPDRFIEYFLSQTK